MASAAMNSFFTVALSFMSGYLYGCDNGAGLLFDVNDGNGTSQDLCTFDDVDESVPKNNKCPEWTFVQGDEPGNVAIVHQGDGKCVFSASKSCGGSDIFMSELSRVELDVSVQGCSNQAWMSVYMFQRLKWRSDQEYDFVETGTNVNPEGPASNFAGHGSQQSWGLTTEGGFKRHVTLQVTSYSEFFMCVEILQCDMGSATCSESLTTPASFCSEPPKGEMQIIVDHWGWGSHGENMGAGQEGCELSVSNMGVVRK